MKHTQAVKSGVNNVTESQSCSSFDKMLETGSYQKDMHSYSLMLNSKNTFGISDSILFKVLASI
jgi:hypothetical protein